MNQQQEKRKYGLVFENYREPVEELLEEKVPVFVEEKELEIANGGRMNYLIEGENLAALTILKKKFQEKIDLILIDPPYNTGRRDLKYRDSFRSHQGVYPHSRWLSFMEKRLCIAAELLNRNGYIFINIDEKELAQLKLLCDEIFGEENFVGIYMWEKTSTPPALSNKVRKKLEYILCYAKNLNPAHRFSQGIIDGGDGPLLNEKNAVKTLVFPENTVQFHIQDGVYACTRSEKIQLMEPVQVKNGKNVNPLIIRGRFRWTQEKLEQEISEGTFFHIRSRKFLIRYQRPKAKESKIPVNLLDRNLGIGTNETAKRELQDMGLPAFTYPKPVSLYAFLIKMINGGQNMTVLDFFAGSGTTGEAVLRVNQETGSSHRFILCTDNQDNICRKMTYKRLAYVIKENQWAAGMKYYRIDYR